MKQIIFEERFAKNFKKLCGVDLLSENKFYPSKTIKSIISKIGDDSEQVQNMIIIFGLFRQQSPFKEVGDISKLTTKQQLTDLFNKWYRSTLIAILKTDKFLDNNDVAKKYLDAYVNNIKSLSDEKKDKIIILPLFTSENIEKTFIDFVNNNRWVKNEETSFSTKSDIYKPQDKDIQHEDENIIIMDGNARSKCVMYGKGETWCISQTDHNMFNTYRVTNGATIYFVLQKNSPSPEHKIVILNYDGQYAIADQTNSGNRTGSSDKAMNWSGIEKELPNLKGKEEYFKYLPITNEERNYHSKVQSKYNGDDIINYVRQNSNNLYLNNSMVTPVDFFTDYLLVGANGSLLDNQFDNLWTNKKDKEVEQMIFKYLSTGVPLNEYQFRIIEKG